LLIAEPPLQLGLRARIILDLHTGKTLPVGAT